MTYLLRDIDAALWVRVKTKAARDGLPIRAVILGLLRGWLRGQIDPRWLRGHID